VTRALPGSAPIERLRASVDVDVWDGDSPPPAEEVRRRAAGCRGILAMLTERIDDELLAACDGLAIVANMAVGYDNIDIAAATRRGVLVTNTPDVLTETTADMAFALLLAVARRVVAGDHVVRSGGWGPWQPSWMLGHEVHGATLGIVGAGRIGRAVARRGGGFGMQVQYHSRSTVPDFPGERTDFESLLATSDFVSVHVPLTVETREMFGARAFAQMRPSAIFINTARGGIVDQAALTDALTRGVIAGAGLDVASPEPLPTDSPLLSAPNLVVTPHLGSSTESTRVAMAALAVDNLLAALAGERPRNLVNDEAWRQP
jgi:glyoxylate reductase